MMQKPQLYLASRSPRRKALLAQLHAEFACLDAEIDETPHSNEPAAAYVQRLSQAKAQFGLALLEQEQLPAALVLAADTIVSKDEVLFGKPGGLPQFRRMMNQLSGGEHQVYTSVSLAYEGGIDSSLVMTRVWFRALETAEIDAYWRSGEPADKAGGYAIQGLAARFVARIDGSYSSVVGLPLLETEILLGAKGLASDWDFPV